jgi:hypothetical protein
MSKLLFPFPIPDDILFDRADSNAQSRLIAGGHFFVRPSAASKAYFTKLANDLSRRYAPDNSKKINNLKNNLKYF